MEIKRFNQNTQEIATFALKGLTVGLGLTYIARYCSTRDFLRWLTNINPERGRALGNSMKDHPRDEMSLLVNVSPLSEKQGIALANKLGRMQLNTNNDKLHKKLLGEVERLAVSMNVSSTDK